MTSQSRSEAQKRADEIRVFQRECERLKQEGVLHLDGAQRAAIATHHNSLLAKYSAAFDIDTDVQAKQLSLGMRAASFLGALALAASVFFLFYQFWGNFPSTTQVSILVAASVGTFLATMWIQTKDASGYFTKLAAMVAFVCFVLNIVMLGQIFNITPSDKALIPWAAYAMLLAYHCDLRLLLAAGILCIEAYVSARTGTWGGMYWLDFGERPENFFPAAALMLFIPPFLHRRHFSEFLPIYRVFGLLTFLLPVLVLSNWGHGSYFQLDHKIIENLYQVIGFAGGASVVWLGARRSWPEVFNTGVTFFVIFLYTKFYDWWWEIMPKYLFFMVLGLTAILILFILRRLRATSGAALKGDAP